MRDRARVVLTQRFGLSTEEVSTLIRSLLRRFDVTMSRLLRDPSEPER